MKALGDYHALQLIGGRPGAPLPDPSWKHEGVTVMGYMVPNGHVMVLLYPDGRREFYLLGKTPSALSRLAGQGYVVDDGKWENEPTIYPGKQYETTILIGTRNSGNPGPGAWYVEITPYGGDTVPLSGVCPATTIQRLPLVAFCAAMSALAGRHKVAVITSSRYVADGVSKWLDKWASQGWKRVPTQRRNLPNVDLWIKAHALVGPHDVTMLCGVHGYEGELQRASQIAEKALIDATAPINPNVRYSR